LDKTVKLDSHSCGGSINWQWHSNYVQ